MESTDEDKMIAQESVGGKLSLDVDFRNCIVTGLIYVHLKIGGGEG